VQAVGGDLGDVVEVDAGCQVQQLECLIEPAGAGEQRGVHAR
jgi:hypothetical protein